VHGFRSNETRPASLLNGFKHDYKFNGYTALLVFFILEIHACNNASPVFKRCILSAVASTSSQGCVRLDRGGGGVTKMFPDVQKFFRTYNFSENTVVFQIHFLMS
jgi:hypothetical protein